MLCRYSGTPLWNVRGQPLVHELVWGLNFVSFFFLYPSTFNLLEVRCLFLISCNLPAMAKFSRKCIAHIMQACELSCFQSWHMPAGLLQCANELWSP